MSKSKVAIIMGSDSDLPLMKPAASVLKEFNVPFEISILSAHRTPKETTRFAERAYKQGIKVIIAGAGGAAHLAGVIASLFPLPVIGVPIKTSTLGGLDSLYSIVQMPSGVPVATVSINGAKNAALLAVQILSLTDQALEKKITDYKKNMASKVLEKNKRIKGYAI